MIIVGSRCGGFDFYAKKTDGSDAVWLGPTEESDIDIFYSKKINSANFSAKLDVFPIKMFRVPNLWFRVEFPHNIDGDIIIPKNLIYLSWAIKKRMGLKLKEIFKMNEQPFEIYDKDKKFVTTIKFRPIPIRTGMTISSA